MKTNWNIKYHEYVRGRVKPRDVTPSNTGGPRPTQSEWLAQRDQLLSEVAVEQHLEDMERLGGHIGTGLRCMFWITIVFPIKAVAFFFKNIHDIMMAAVGLFTLGIIYIIFDLTMRIP